MYDVIIIGGGVSGTASARELSRYRGSFCLLEKEEDLCSGTSKANSGIVHAGYDAPAGSLMAELNVRGNEKMEALSKELDFPFKRNGSLVLCFSPEELPALEALLERGRTNGVKGLRILDREEVLEMEPNVSDEVYAALYAPTAGIVCPFEMNLAFGENAYENGYRISTNKGEFDTRCIVNAAGVYADVLHNMVSRRKLRITPRRGDYCLLDKSAGSHVSRTVFALPGKEGKGVLVTPTVHGNLLIGPTAIDIREKEGTNTTAEGLAQVIKKAGKNVKNLPLRQVITSFSGLRPHEDGQEFIIEEAEDAPGFIDCAGSESPGLTSALAIGERVAEILREKLSLEEKENFKSKRKGLLRPSSLSIEERNELIKKNPAYGNIICRCEMVTEGEILEAIRRPLGAKSLDGATPHKGRDGPLSVRFLFAQGYGTPCPGAGGGAVRDHQVRKRFKADLRNK